MSAPRERLLARATARVGKLHLDVDLDSVAGTLIVIGPNGAGKTTLLALLLGVLPVERGRISVGSTVLLDTDAHVDVPLEQRGLGYVPQYYALFPHLNVEENIMFALCSAEPRLQRSTRLQRVANVLHELGIEALARRHPRTLSGGEKQRVALARALCVNPRALLLDEPLAALDVRSRPEVRELLGAYLSRLRIPTIVVTHDALDAQRLGQRIAVLDNGRVVQTGSWPELSAAPASRFVEEFVRDSQQAARFDV